MANTTHAYCWNGASFLLWKGLWAWTGSWTPAKAVWAWDSAWKGVYSTPTVSASNASGSNSGTAGSGSVTSGTPNTTPGGTSIGSLSYAWTQLGGSAMSISNAAAQNPTWSATVSNGSPLSATWQVQITDGQTGATNTTSINVSLTYTQVAPPLSVSVSLPSQSVSGVSPSFFFNGSGSATPSGGVPGYTYLWTYLSGDNTIICSNPNISNPSFSTTISPGPGTTENKTANWRCTVTDSIGQTAHDDGTVFYEYSRN